MPSQKKDSSRKVPSNIVDAQTGYNLVARSYDSWHWQFFWERNETPAIEKMLRSLPNSYSRVLDAGAGTGRLFQLIQSLGHEVYGFDISPNMLAIAASRLGCEGNPEPFLRLGDVREIPFSERSFDCVLCCRVLSHVQELQQALAELFRVLERGAFALVTDVDGRHRYEATRIPVQDENVWIRVYKHTFEDVMSAAIGVGFCIVDQHLIHADDLDWQPHKADFPAIDWSGDTPISYRLLLQRPW